MNTTCNCHHKNPDSVTAAGDRVEGAPPDAATRNACKLCSPLGASMVFNGIRGCLSFLHGSQGCATYIRRYMISHFREPVDIASSSFSEDDAIFGGARNFEMGLNNVIQQYHPECIGVATTCLSETIGENMIGMIKEYKESHEEDGTPPLVHVSTPAYTGTHSDGYYSAIREVVAQFAKETFPKVENRVAVFPSMMSCEDLRHLRELCGIYGLDPVMVPDYSTRLEGSSWGQYNRIPPGGTPISDIQELSNCSASLEIGHLPAYKTDSAGTLMEKRFETQRHALGWPLGIRLSDQFFTSLSQISGRTMPESIEFDRGRLIDAYVDAHKYVSEKKAVVFGEPDLVLALASFLSEIGIRPVVCATGSKVKGWKDMLSSEIEGGIDDIECLNGADHAKIAEKARELKPHILVGSSKGYPLARELGVPLMRVGFPIHDRFGGQRQLTVGYKGSLAMFDRVVNALMESKQENSNTGYSYL